MTRRSRLLLYGAAGLLLVAGIVCAVFVAGVAGELLATVLIGVSLVGLVSLLFLEVGLSEDRDRARELRRSEAERNPAPPVHKQAPDHRRPAMRRPARMRGERRRLR
ncbi:MAG: hypothetical protein ACLP50_03280 [Solirubrobacteraceae bacterium]